MSNEFIWDTITGQTLYAIRWQPNGDAFLTNGASDEAYGAGGNDADDYDVTMPEVGVASGHYVGNFDTGAAIAAGFYPYTIYLQAGGSPADSDKPIAKGMMYWDGTAEIDLYTLTTAILSGVIEGTITVKESLRLMLATLAGKASGGGTGTLIFRDTTDSKDRITATVDINGNRTVVSRDVS